MVDAGQVQAELGRYGLDWSVKLPSFWTSIWARGCGPLAPKDKAHRVGGEGS